MPPESSEYLKNLFGLEGQTAVVIGGSGVLGGAIAHGFARAGAALVISGRSDGKGEHRVGQLRALGASASFHAVDVCSRDSLRELLDYTLSQHERVDILVNCAGINSKKPYFELEEHDWDCVLDTNLRATHYACQVFGQQMAKQPEGGAILNIGSVTAHTPLSHVFAYSASKAGVVSLTKNLAREFAPYRIRVNVLCPGFFPADQNRELLTPERTEKIMAGTPLQRFGEPDELVGAALLLVSRKAGSFMTGADVYVDGGFTGMRF